ncbi:MAG: carbamoyltransferase HypF [Lachnospira sp.]|nr:carbamoyltransferase HypF [Lachnospira sp.]
MKRMLIRAEIHIFGIVQGVGFRPFAARLAGEFSLSGHVLNRGTFVEIIVEGDDESVEGYIRSLKEKAPQRAVILKLDAKRTRISALSCSRFTIEESRLEEGAAFIPPDIAICDTCSRELFDPGNRRYLHPFINCTQCGPRLTIMDGLPYDRGRTSMKIFPMCPECRKEYKDPVSRRYDAQPVCCNHCGPEVFLLDDEKVRAGEAITRVRQTIMDGGIAAVKGIGGFHLVCNAADAAAVDRLRKRKNRMRKPFAVMAADPDTAARECSFDEEQRKILTGHQKPILLLKKRAGDRAEAAPKVAENVAPDNPFLGIMLPYAPVQLLLFRYPDRVVMSDILVMTSANDSGAPICRTDAEAREELSGIADVILTNNRPILIRSDDSVMEFCCGKPCMVRRSRGFAPLPLLVDVPAGQEAFHGTVFAAGGELKNVFTIGINGLFYPSPYVGDLQDERTLAALEQSSSRMEEMLGARPDVVACDMHPGYASVAFARQKAEALGVPLVMVQHHYAHVLSCMAENNHPDPVLGVVFDGTGYGTDGTVWGGEILRCDYDGFVRMASIAPFRMPGADMAARQGWRCAVSMLLDETGLEKAARISGELSLAQPKTVRILDRMRKSGVNTVVSTSAGRLFDAVSAVLSVRRESSFEGEAASALEFAAMEYEEKVRESERQAQLQAFLLKMRERSDESGMTGGLPDAAEGTPDRRIIPTDRLFREIVQERLRQLRAGSAGEEETECLAWLFHAALARITAEEVLQETQETGIRSVALSGGSFQNTLLTRILENRLVSADLTVLRHHLIPPNDGGISLGQAIAAAQKMSKESIMR